MKKLLLLKVYTANILNRIPTEKEMTTFNSIADLLLEKTKNMIFKKQVVIFSNVMEVVNAR